jgi:hypothetical protein
MITKIIKVVRPNTEVNFYEFSLEFVAHRLEKYINSGKITLEVSMSEDGLTKTTVFEFLDQAAQIEYSSDPVIKEEIKSRNMHNKSNNIKIINSSIQTALV